MHLMSWTDIIPTLAVCVVLLLGPGAALARVMGARGLTLWASAAPLTVFLTATGAIILQLLHIGWSVGSSLGVAAIAVALAAAVRLGWSRLRAGEWRTISVDSRSLRVPGLRTAGYFLALGIPAGIVFYRFSKIIGSPDHISQTYDNVFHLNAIRTILDSGRASSLTMAALDPNSSRVSFYPGAWHDVVALVIEASGSAIPVGITATNIVVAGLVWPLSAIFLVSTLTGKRLMPALITGTLAAGFSSFPYLMIDFGVLYPNLLSIAILPLCLGAVVRFLGLGRDTKASRRLNLSLVALSAVGLTLAHPSTTMALIALSAAPMGFWFVERLRSLQGRAHRIRILATSVGCVVAYTLIAIWLWTVVRPSEAASSWPPKTTLPRAIGEALTSSPLSRDIPWLIFAFTIVGVVVLSTQRRLWVVGSFAVSVALYGIVSGYPAGPVRSFWTGIWYNDSYRLAALLPVTTIAIAAVGGSWLIERAVQYVRRNGQPHQVKLHAVRTASSLLLICLAAALVQGRTISIAQANASHAYSSSLASPLLSNDEEALLKRLDRHVPADAVVIGNPWTGAALVYAFSGRQAMLPAISSSPTSSERSLLSHLGQITEDPNVCEIVRREKTNFVLDFGPREVHNGNHPFPSSEELAQNTGLKLVDEEGDAKLYEIVACQ
ncbi:DUF6541 family protein [Arthrobacter sp. Hor0625]|uniref:DUF6541 family protein n=1 Tax=Arthrobacter sp. Hor0625 TaxID=3457358 RepID=UPI00403EAD01